MIIIIPFRISANCVEGDVRLAVSDDIEEYYAGLTDYDSAYYDKNGLVRGRVEICNGAVYGTICFDSWDNQDASVVCRQLDFSPYGNHQCVLARRVLIAAHFLQVLWQWMQSCLVKVLVTAS